ncbi:hypothetical protein AGMMS49992_14950 [Clostridia bacterium]|nr:hypothetical protein AGMMS49992_14950 [Clostridia bacterium]
MRLWLINALRALVLGIACILPGMSAGVIALSMGLYQPILTALVGFRSDKRGNAKFLSPLVVGIGAGVLLTARAMSAVFQRAAGSITVLFIGLVLGGLPALWRQATQGGADQPEMRRWSAGNWTTNIILMVSGFSLIYLFGVLSRVATPTGTPRIFEGWVAVLGGAIYAFALIIPGISSSFLLLFLGLYQPMMDVLGHPLTRWRALLLVAAGGLACGAALIKVVEWLLRRFPIQSRFVVMGFVLGSVWIVFSWDAFAAKLAIHLLMIIAGFAVSSQFDRMFEGHDAVGALAC